MAEIVDLHYKKWGDSDQALVIVHGFLGSSDNWNTLAKRFSAYFSVYAVDVRNHGRSPHSEEHNYTVMSRDLIDLIEKEQMSSVNLIGHSMGGKVALQIAKDAPQRLDTMIVVDMALRQNPPSHDHILAAIKRMDVASLTSRREASDELSEYITDPGVVQFLLKNLARAELGFKWKFNMETLIRDYPEILKGVYIESKAEVPSLFIKGGKSQYINKNDKLDIEKNFLDVRVVEIEDAGHWVHAERPIAFFDACMTFYKQKGIV